METQLYVVMGVAGAGKSSIGVSVAKKLGGTYIDGDDFHPQSNIDKMSKGQPLTDGERWPWLEIVASELSRLEGIGLVGCSALKKTYRSFISKSVDGPVKFIYLDGSEDLILERMAARDGHFMPASLLRSQFSTLEKPDKSENAISIDISGTQEEVVTLIVDAITKENENGK